MYEAHPGQTGFADQSYLYIKVQMLIQEKKWQNRIDFSVDCGTSKDSN